MIKKIIIVILISTFLIQVAGCYSWNVINKENLNKVQDEDIWVITKEGKESGELNNWFVKNDTIVINSTNNEQKIPLKSIAKVSANQFDGVKTTVLIASLTLIVGTLIYFVLKVRDDWLHAWGGNFFK